MSDELTPEVIRQWLPADHAGLHAAWRDLFPELQGFEHTRRFEGRDLTAQQAGWVFEHWVCSAFRPIATPPDRVRGPFTVRLETSEKIKEELDGSVILGWQGFLIQSKLRAIRSPSSPSPASISRSVAVPNGPWACSSPGSIPMRPRS